MSAKIDLEKIKILNIFKYIRNNGNISDEEIYDCYEIGVIEKGKNKVEFKNKINWL